MDLVPPQYRLLAAAGAALGLLAVGAATGWQLEHWRAGRDMAALQARQATAAAELERRYSQALQEARRREAELIQRTEEIVDAARQADATLRASRAAADAAGVQLRAAAAAYAARRCQAATAAGRGDAGGLSGGLQDGDRLLRVLGELDGRAGQLADVADRARSAGLACERIYNAARATLN